jgi:branched-chain amino acid transport system permease protein
MKNIIGIISKKQNTKLTKYLLIAAVLLLPLALGLFGNYWVRIADQSLLYIMLALGLNIVVGFAGLLDLGYIAFFAVGAYLTGFLSSPHLTNQFDWIHNMFPNGLHLSVWFIIPLAGLVAALFGILLGSPTLKLRGDYLAIVTLGFGEIIRIFMNNLDRPINITNGPKGIKAIDSVSLFGFKLDNGLNLFGFKLSSETLYYYLFVALTVIIIIICKRIQDSRMGRAWVAIREDEIAAKAMGINTRNMKLAAFALGASFGGVSGAMFASFQQFVSPESFVLWESIVILAMVVIGGIGHIPGVILGGIVLSVMPEFLRAVLGPIQENVFGKIYLEPEVARQLFFSLSLLLVMLFKTEGLWPAPKHEDIAGK